MNDESEKHMQEHEERQEVIASLAQLFRQPQIGRL